MRIGKSEHTIISLLFFCFDLHWFLLSCRSSLYSLVPVVVLCVLCQEKECAFFSTKIWQGKARSLALFGCGFRLSPKIGFFFLYFPIYLSYFLIFFLLIKQSRKQPTTLYIVI
ncbi:hypothetical protein BX070DRAFT_144700 [Coemansia spiralis]|nr:hypothetical protein BX070DRAFT_144700 [Coemansia spiralis]